MLLDRLRARHSKVTGNGPEWAYMEHVRDDAAHFAQTTIDALAIHMWPSRHHEAHAFEVKVTLQDFRRELVDDARKSAAWRAWVEYFWIVAPTGVIPPCELSVGWGLIETRGTGLTVRSPAQRLRPSPAGCLPDTPLPRGLVVAMLRSQVRNAAKVNGRWTAVPTTALEAMG